MRLLVFVPARGGSKRIPRKNIAPLAGKPLIGYTLDLCRGLGLLDRTVVSTEDDEIAAVARAGGADVLRRPLELAADNASTDSAMLHALSALEAEGRGFDWVLTLPPTAPLRRGETVLRFLDAARAAPAELDCLMSVTETRGDFWLRGADGRPRRLFPDAPRRQQDRAPLFEENSAIYLTRVAALRSSGLILGRSVELVPIDPLEAIDINTPADLAIVEAVLARGLWDERG